MNYKAASILSLSLLATVFLLSGCQPGDQQTPGEDPMDAPTSPQQGAAAQPPQAQAPADAQATQETGQPPQNEEGAPQASVANDDGQRLFEQHCAVCHTLDLPRAQRLNLSTWREVVADMVGFGMTWVSDEEQELIVEHLAENYGRETPR